VTSVNIARQNLIKTIFFSDLTFYYEPKMFLIFLDSKKKSL